MSPVAGLAIRVPGTARTVMSRPLIVEQTRSAVATVRPRSTTVLNPALRAVRYRRVSRTAGSWAASSSSMCLNNSSVVVTMFSISELACASSSGIVLISTVGLGMLRLA